MTDRGHPSVNKAALPKLGVSARLRANGTTLLLMIAATWAGTACASEVRVLAPEKDQAEICGALIEALHEIHYRDQPVDDALSHRILERYLKALDPSHLFFLARDVREFHRYDDKLDDALRRGDMGPAYEIFNRFQQRRRARNEALVVWVDSDLADLRFDGDETVRVDRAESPWPSDLDEADQIWRRHFKNDVLNLRLADRDNDEIHEILQKRYRDRVRRIDQVNDADVFRIFMNVVTACYGPHTEYYPPHESENFDITMSLSVEGIGALLSNDGEYCRVDRIIPGGPADRDGRLRASDRIIGVGEGDDAEMVDVVGWRNDEIVDRIRGKKGSVVRLNVLAAEVNDSSLAREIRLVRDEVQLKEQEARKYRVDRERDGLEYRVGVVQLPAFYMDFEAARRNDPDYTSSTRDVARLVAELKDEGVDGIVVDLRGNGGGSLIEAHELTSLFLGAGPVVQVRDSKGRVDVLGSRDGKALYDGPLVVLVDRLSASASEIFAGAIQDSGRGVIVGQRTFGKGTVQGLARIGEGRLKVTQAMFYRINGASTQHAGVTPDIELPPLYDPDQIGESALDDPLPWDSIDPVFRKDPAIERQLPELRRRHQARVARDPEFVLLNERLAYAESIARDFLSLNEERRRAEQKDAEATLLAMENRRRRALGEDEVASLDEVTPRDDDEIDPYAVEAAEILIDTIGINRSAKTD